MMGWVAALQGSVVGLDTTPLIYFIEENPSYIGLVRPFFEAPDRAEFTAVTSFVTLRGPMRCVWRRGRVLASPSQDVVG